MKPKLKTKSMSVLLVLVITMTTLVMGNLTANAAETETKPQIMLGDVNGDGDIDVDDATTLQKYLVHLIDLNDTQKKAADAYEDEGNLDINDVTEIQKHLVHLESNKNIGKTWHDAETTTKTTLRYILINPNVCNTCNVPFIYEDGSHYPVSKHHAETGHSGYRSQYDWYYIDENGHYHDLDDNGKVPYDHATEIEDNVFDPGFNPAYNWVSIKKYNETHKNQFYWSVEQYAVCNSCNSDGTCIYDEWGGTGNLKDGQLKLTDPVETIIYPETVADVDTYNKVYDENVKALDDHLVYHKLMNDIPEYIGDDIDSYIINISRIYNTETVTKEAGLY